MGVMGFLGEDINCCNGGDILEPRFNGALHSRHSLLFVGIELIT